MPARAYFVLLWSALLGYVAFSALACSPPEPPRSTTPKPGGQHVQLVHLDGYRPDLTRALLEAGRLPRLGELVERGRISYRATTVDKSETMKVVQSYLTSQLDTTVVGWWQFDRRQFRFTNFWLDPAEVLNFALGLEFPVSPTIHDFLASRGQNLVAGMSLARRSVPFANYGRAYLEGIEAVSAHTYFEQADATMRSFLDVHHRIATNGDAPPALSTLLLAAADEFSHAYGVTTQSAASEHCFRRDDDHVDPTMFRLLDDDPSLAVDESGYFTRVERSSGGRGVDAFCIELPDLDGRRFEPRYVLSMLVLDIELGTLMDAFKAVRYEGGESLFDRTLFIVFGDHGMVHTENGMVDADGGESFITYLDRRLGLETGLEGNAIATDAELGIDYVNLPRRLREPDRYPEWQSDPIRAVTGDASLWSQEFFVEAREVLRANLHENYWWLFFLKSVLVDPKLDGTLGPVTEEALATFRALYLRSVPEYRDALKDANRDFYDRYVRLVYGGGARNNAEIFLPVCPDSSTCSWDRRPRFDEIVGYRGGALMEALTEHPGVGLIFIRKNNEAFTGTSLPATMEVEVRDRAGNRGTITTTRDVATGELVFRYRAEPDSAKDPLGYEAWDGVLGTYNEWNDWTIESEYVNVVGGMGAYLYSVNPAIGDVVVMHATNWNFGENLGGHGGLHGGEKRTMLLVSGPSVTRGELLARARFRTAEDRVVATRDGTRVTHVPTLLDITPTALRFLGYEPSEMDAFAATEFEDYLDDWIRGQHADILAHLQTMSSVEKAKDEAGLDDLSVAPLMPHIARMLQFVGAAREDTLARVAPRPMLGNELILNEDEDDDEDH